MSLFRVNSCCSCISLRTGCLIIGYLICFGTVYQLMRLMDNTQYGMVKPHGNSGEDDDTVLIKLTDTSKEHAIAEENYRNQMHYRARHAIGGECILNLITAITLLIGTYKRNPDFLLPYMILSVIEIIGLAILLFILFLFSGYFIVAASDSEGKVIGIMLYIVGAILGILTFLKLYFFLVVKSHYDELKRDRETDTHLESKSPYCQKV